MSYYCPYDGFAEVPTKCGCADMMARHRFPVLNCGDFQAIQNTSRSDMDSTEAAGYANFCGGGAQVFSHALRQVTFANKHISAS